jgi:hypothetical protein
MSDKGKDYGIINDPNSTSLLSTGAQVLAVGITCINPVLGSVLGLLYPNMISHLERLKNQEEINDISEELIAMNMSINRLQNMLSSFSDKLERSTQLKVIEGYFKTPEGYDVLLNAVETVIRTRFEISHKLIGLGLVSCSLDLNESDFEERHYLNKSLLMKVLCELDEADIFLIKKIKSSIKIENESSDDVSISQHQFTTTQKDMYLQSIQFSKLERLGLLFRDSLSRYSTHGDRKPYYFIIGSSFSYVYNLIFEAQINSQPSS